MKELTLEQKIEFCNKYIADSIIDLYDEFICNNFEVFVNLNFISQETFKELFPELLEFVMVIGLELDSNYRYGAAWHTGNTFAVRRAFRVEKMKEFLKTLTNNGTNNQSNKKLSTTYNVT